VPSDLKMSLFKFEEECPATALGNDKIPQRSHDCRQAVQAHAAQQIRASDACPRLQIGVYNGTWTMGEAMVTVLTIQTSLGPVI
jgi:hypothetical protein